MVIDYTAMVAVQLVNQEIQAYRTAIANLQLADMPVCQTGPVLLCDVSTGSPCPIVPTQYQRQVFDVMHNLVHPGRKAIKTIIR